MIATWAAEPDPADGPRSGSPSGPRSDPADGPTSLGARGGYEDLAARGTFDSLLRSLLSWELVTQCIDGEDGGPAEWRLSEIAQRRLSQLQPAVPRLDERTVYFGHVCIDCRQRRPTRLLEGVYRCESCAERRRLATGSGIPVDTDVRETTRRGQPRGGLWERRRRHQTGTGPAAGAIGDQRTSA